MELDFGAPAGLAYRHDWNAAKQSDMYVNQLKQQAKIDAANRAKLLTDDLNFGTANNTWDMTQIKNFTNAKIKEYGKYIAENPDWETNLAKRAEVKRQKQEFLNNDHVARGMRIDTHYSNMIKFYQDPKNGDFRDDPYMAEKMKEYQNYAKTGSIDGDTNHGLEFSFQSPAEQVDTHALIRAAATKVKRDGIASHAGAGGNKQFVTTTSKQRFSGGMISDPKFGKYIRTEWNNLDDDSKKSYGNIENYVATIADPYFPEDKIHVGQFFNPYGKGGKGSGKNGDVSDPFQRDIIQPLFSSPTTPVKINPGAIDLVQQNGKGEYNLSDAEISTNGKDFKTINLGMLPAKSTGRVIMRMNHSGQKYMANEVMIDMNEDQFKEKFGSDALDYKNFNNITQSADEYDDVNIRDEHQNWVQKTPDKDGKPRFAVRSYVQLRNDENSRALYRKALHGKTEGFGNNGNIEVDVYEDQEGRFYNDPSTGERVDVQ